MAGFPYHALDTYFPKLIRAGHRISICNQQEAPKGSKKKVMQPTEVVEPAQQELFTEQVGNSFSSSITSHGLFREFSFVYQLRFQKMSYLCTR